MKMNRLSQSALVLLLSAIHQLAPAACVRSMPMPGEDDSLQAEIKRAVDNSEAVFVGKVTAMDYVPVDNEIAKGGEMLVIRLAPTAKWKGAQDETVSLRTAYFKLPNGGESFEAHEFRYEMGKTYLVYAYASGDGLYANTCTRTKPIEAAAADIAVLDALKAN